MQNGWAASNNGSGYCTTLIPINYDSCSPDHPDPCHRPCNWNAEVGFKSSHEGIAHFLLGDGSVRAISENIDHQVYQYLGAKNDGKVVGEILKYVATLDTIRPSRTRRSWPSPS